MRVLLLMALFLSLFTASAQAQENANTSVDDVRLFMTFVPNVQFSPVYAAQAKGFFGDQGLSVAWEHGDEPVAWI